MADWDSSGHVQIERAKEHIEQFAIVSREFLDLAPYQVLLEPDAESGSYVIRILERETAPFRLSAIASDAVHNLRSSLDILWRLVMYGPRSGVRKQYFPICATAEKLEARFQGVPKSPRHKTAVEIVKATKPYKGGNDALWTLNALDARNKHEMLTLTIGTFRSLLIEFFPKKIVHMRREDYLSPVEDGTVMFRLAADIPVPPMEMKREFVLDIVFGEGEVLEGEAVLPTLHQFADVVEGIVGAFRIANLLR